MTKWLCLCCALAVGCGGADVFVGDSGSTEGGDGSSAGDGSSGDGASLDAPVDGMVCKGKHPIVDGGRYCGQGDCYCTPNDTCFPMGTAQTCCSVTVKCN